MAGKAPKVETDAPAADSDEGEEDFEADYEDSDDDSDASSSSDDGEEGGGDDDELDELAAEAGEAGETDEAGPSSGGGKRKRKVSDDEPSAQILEGLSGDEVDPNLIVAGGRRGRAAGGGAGPSKPKYTAQAQLDSDEDDW